jgi:hypothetical protein
MTGYNMYNWNIFESGVKYHNDSNSNAPSSSNSWWRLYNYYQLSEFLLSVDSWMSSFSNKYMTDTQGLDDGALLLLSLWYLTPLSKIFQLYMLYIVACEGNRCTRRKPPTHRKSLTTFEVLLDILRHKLSRKSYWTF